MKKKIIISSIAMIALCLCLIAGSTFALFTAETTVDIAVTAGDLEVSAEIVKDSAMFTSLGDYDDASAVNPKEDFKRKDNFANGGSAALTDGKLVISQMTPGDGVCFKVKVKNTGDVAVKYTLKASDLGPNKDQAEAKDKKESLWGVLEIKAYTLDGVVLEGANTYTAATVAPDQEIEFYVTVVFPNGTPAEQNKYQGGYANVQFTVEAVQANGVENGQLITN